MKKIRILAQVVGAITLGLLVVYGLLSLLGLAQLPSALASGISQQDAPYALTPAVINYQGTLRKIDGSLINDVFTMTFKLYNDPVGGTLLHEETIENVNVRDSLFTVLIGDTKPLDPEIFKGKVYVGVQVENDTEMVPRQRIAPAAFAIQLTNGVFVDRDGRVGVGTQDPQAQLEVNGNTKVTGNMNITGNAEMAGSLNVDGVITSLSTVPSDPVNVVTTKDYVDTKWPDGHYCILMAEGSCPAGFATGGIYVDGEDSDPSTSCSGNIGNSSCSTAGASFAFCCK
jgi:hypothetical protein